MSMPEYIALKAFSGGLATKILNDCPFAAWYASPWNPSRGNDASKESDIGTYAHAMLLEGKSDKLVVIQADDWRTKAAKEQRDAARAEGLTPILAHKIAAVENMVDAAKRFIATTELADIFDTGGPEQTLTWTENGVPCKARPDWLPADGRINLSYKTSASANPRAWIRSVLPGHDVGMVLYERGIRSVLGVAQCRTVHLVQSQEPPHACSLIALAPSWQDLAERRLDMALAIWRECLERKEFPSYGPRIHHAEAATWQAAQFEEQFSAAEVLAALEPGYGNAPNLDVQI